MKNILYLHAGAEMYGADKILLELVTGLDKTKYHPIVVLPNEGILVDELKKQGIKTYVVNYPILRRKYFNPKGIWQYVSSYISSCKEIITLLRKLSINIDIIHVNTIAVLEGIYLKEKLNTKLIWHVHEILLKPKLVANFINSLVGKYSDRVVAVSKAVASHLVDGNHVYKDKVDVIYNGVNSDRFNPSVKINYLYKEWNIPSDSLKVGMIGRVNAWKGQGDFLKATVPLLRKYPNLYLFIIGSAFAGQEWRVNALKEKIQKMKYADRIVFSEYRSDVPALDAFFDILVLPSTNPDPLPTVVLEAMSSGTPVIGYNHGGVTEMVVDRETGALARACDHVDLRNKIDSCLSKKSYIDEGKTARNRILEKFSEQAFISNFESLYNLV